MLTIEKRTDGVLHMTADGRLTREDFAAFVPRFEHLAQASNPMLIELGPDFTGWTLGGAWDDLKFDAGHKRQFGRMAIVGDRRWQKWGTEASNPFFAAEMRFFEAGEKSRAEAWLRGTAQDPRAN